ncbi:Mini-ribonuclease 3 [Erysipelothrix urinaevulpis]|uniref:Mini-ribonuclease 3 n=1 Tax=Erysipelothrix urinaevulpis TaxID=2683717 RepID=UPI001357F0C3|nr:ribonuclease III domain-containing protein [Erysipelothrix urinaevulpis]
MNHSGNVLAFIGDAVMSLQVREYLVSLGLTKTKELQETSVKFVSAEAQSKFMTKMLDDNILSDDELAIYRRGRNAKSASAAKNADIKDYRIATGFEALWGYLHMSKQLERLEELWELFKSEVEL